MYLLLFLVNGCKQCPAHSGACCALSWPTAHRLQLEALLSYRYAQRQNLPINTRLLNVCMPACTFLRYAYLAILLYNQLMLQRLVFQCRVFQTR